MKESWPVAESAWGQVEVEPDKEECEEGHLLTCTLHWCCMAGQLIVNYVFGVCSCAFPGLCTYSVVAQVTKFTLISFLTFWYSNVILRQLHCNYLCAYVSPSLSLSLSVCVLFGVPI